MQQTEATQHPVLLASRGKGVAEKTEEERPFMRAVMQVVREIESGNAIPLAIDTLDEWRCLCCAGGQRNGVGFAAVLAVDGDVSMIIHQAL